MTLQEEPIDPDIPIVDSHHHLFDEDDGLLAKICDRSRFLVGEYADYVSDGHNVVASIVVEGHTRYRADGPERLRVVGETEFLNDQGAIGASGLRHGVRVAAGIIGGTDLRQGDAVREVLEAHLAVAPNRFKGIRQHALWDADPTIFGDMFDHAAHLYLEDAFRDGFRHLAPLGLSFDALVLAPQLADVAALARSFPETSIVLNHLGHPLGIGAHAGKLEEEYPAWQKDMNDIASCQNVTVKMGGLGSFASGSPTFRADPPASSEVLAAEWRPYAEHTVELFGADRVMFETNVPTDGSGPFNTVCNAYKRIVAGCSEDERRQIFAGTAASVYRLDSA